MLVCGDESVPLRQLRQTRRSPAAARRRKSARYLARISGPLLDRIDMQLEVTAVPVRQITESAPEEPSADIHTARAGRAGAPAGAIRGRRHLLQRGAFRAPAGNVLPAGRRMPRAARQSLRHLSTFPCARSAACARSRGRLPILRARGGNRQGAPAGSAALSKSGRKLLEVRDGNHAANPKRWRFWSARA